MATIHHRAAESRADVQAGRADISAIFSPSDGALAPLAPATDGQLHIMRRVRRSTYLLLFVASLGGLGCESEKEKARSQAASQAAKVARPASPAAPPAKPSAWFRGAFEGTAELAPSSPEEAGEGKAGSRERAQAGEKNQAEAAKAGEPLLLSLELVLGQDDVSGSGTAWGETLVVSGIADASAARLSIVGQTVRGTFVGHADEKEKTFKGTARLSRTETVEGRVSRESYSGELLLESGK